MKFRILFILLIAHGACANPETPPGGPADITAPQITAVNPPSGTTFFDGSAIEIEFDEWVRTESLTENIFVSPPTEFEVDWSGPRIAIEFSEELRPNTTYAVTIGSEVRDYRGNTADRSTTIILATGAVLDSGIVRGRVYGAQDGAFVFLYPLQNLDRDTLDPRHSPPRYLTQIGKSGEFEFQALAPGDYRVLAVDDSFRNRLFDPGTDGWGMAPGDVTLDAGESLQKVSLRMRAAEDLQAPVLYEVRTLGPRKFAAIFNEKLDSASLMPSAFALSDSAGSQTVTISRLHLDAENATSVIFYTEDSLAQDRPWALDAFAVRDSAQNVIADTASIAIFSAAERLDTNRPKLLAWPFKASQSGVRRNGGLNLLFDAALRPVAEPTALQLTNVDTDSVLATTITQPLANQLRLNFDAELPSGVVIRLDINARQIIALNGRRLGDSTLSRVAITSDPREFGDASGKLTSDAEYSGAYILQLRPVDAQSEEGVRQVSLTLVDGKADWNVSALKPGSYDIVIFRDANANGRFDYGQVFPFEAAEEFRIFPAILRVKPRWTTQDINLSF